MKTAFAKLTVVAALFAIGTLMTTTASADCGGFSRVKHGATFQRQAWHEEDPIVGMWHVIFTAQTMNGAPFSAVIDNSVVVWHPDGTEIMNSSRPAQDGNFCLGVWSRTGPLTYYLNHIPWAGNDLENAPGGIGNPQGGAQLTERVTLSPDGNSYRGHFTLDAYDTSGNLTVSFTGLLKAKRITTSTSFADIFKQQ
jgi:hypothetical protein